MNYPDSLQDPVLALCLPSTASFTIAPESSNFILSMSLALLYSINDHSLHEKLYKLIWYIYGSSKHKAFMHHYMYIKAQLKIQH